MNRYGTLGQTAWFVFGSWAGVCFSQLADVLQNGEFKIRHLIDDGSKLPFMLFLYLPMSTLLALIFAAWFKFRGSKLPSRAPWALPFVGGLIYLPLLGALIPVLCIVYRQSRGPAIGMAVATLLFGMPLLFAEVCFRMSRYVDGPTLDANSAT